jgi:arginase
LQFHISFNVDALDPNYINSTGTAVENGLHPEQVRNIIEETLEDNQLKSMDVVEFNPMIGDPNHSIKNLRRVFRDFFQNEFLHNSK